MVLTDMMFIIERRAIELAVSHRVASTNKVDSR
jgi:hypothetical protein